MAVRYSYSVNNIFNYDVPCLTDEIREGGFNDILIAIHIGNRRLVIEFNRELIQAEITTVQNILANHIL